jgi:glycosyltransferase involved in cell wall biosynthesis
MKGTGLTQELCDWPRRAPSSSPWEERAAAEGAWPRVSLVTPSFNQGQFLEDTILSVLNQGYPDLEYMVIDGGSTDGSPEVIRRYADRLAYWESTPDRGQSHAINKGWGRATGKYLWWLNSDDLLMPGSLVAAVRFLETHPDVDLVYGDVVRVDAAGRWVDYYPYRDFDFAGFVLRRHDLAQPGSLMRRDVLQRIGILDEGLHFLMDLDYWRRLAIAGGRIVHLPQPLSLFRTYDEAKTGAGSPEAVQERYLLNERLFADPNLPGELRAKEARVTSGMHLTCARTYLLCGDYRQAVLEAGWSVRSWPIQLANPFLWYHGVLGVLGVVVGHRAWRWLRSGLRRLRGALRPDGGGEQA